MVVFIYAQIASRAVLIKGIYEYWLCCPSVERLQEELSAIPEECTKRYNDVRQRFDLQRRHR